MTTKEFIPHESCYMRGTRYMVSSADQVLLTPDVFCICMLTEQHTLLEVRTLIQLHTSFVLSHIPEMILHYGDLTDASSLVRLVTEVCTVVRVGWPWGTLLYHCRLNLMRYTILVLKVMLRYASRSMVT